MVDSYTHRLDSYAEWKQDQDAFDDFLRGKWTVEMPDGKKVEDTPKIENRVRTGIEDLARLAGSFMPTIRVEAPTEAKVARAATREQLINYYHQRSRTKLLLPRLYADAAGIGLAVLKVWPDFRDPLESRFPEFSRIDPRGVLPPPGWEPNTEPDDVMVTRHQKVRHLRRLYPEAMGLLSNRLEGNKKLRDTDEVQVIEYYDADTIMGVVTHGEQQATLFRFTNRIGRLPLVLVPRLTADGRIRGMFGDVLAVLAAENRLVTYALDYADQLVYSPIIKRGMPGQDIVFGPGSIIDVPVQGDISRLGPPNMAPELFRIQADLERQSRRGAVMPEARSGDIPQSIGSAAFVESLMGGLTTNIRAFQQAMEAGLELANEVAQELDRVYCDAPKSIVGYAQGGQFKMTYTPSKAIREGDVSNIVTYGAGSGLDAFNRELRLLRREQAGYVSKRWVREQLEGVENPVKLENQIIDERALDALLAGVYEQAAQGNLEPLARLQAAREGNLNPLMVLPEIVASSAPPGPAPGEAAQPPALPGEATPGQQIAAANTGAPGGGTTVLPPIGAL